MIISAEKIVIGGRCHQGLGIHIDSSGRIASVAPISELQGSEEPMEHLAGKVLMPGMINAHSHAFQRLLRGRTHLAGPVQDNFWTWRKLMYQVASTLSPESIRVASRQVFLEMLLSGVTTVGEFHYVHHQVGGAPYDDPSLLALAVIEAARDVGIRIVLLRTVYLRGDFDTEPSEHQRRFCDGSLEDASTRIAALQSAVTGSGEERVSVGVAAHSVRAMSKENIVSLKALHGNLPWHIHVSEQRREVESCKEVYGVGPVELLARGGVLDGLTTLVHATHLEPGEAERIAEFDAMVCVCPSTEADLGDGLINATALAELEVRMALGTDGQTLSSVLQEARRLEMHERLRRETRNALALEEGASPVARIFAGATVHGARSLNVSAGELAEGLWADCVSYDLNDPLLVGLDDDSLLGTLLFSGDSRALADVMVGGEWVVRDGVHPLTEKTGSEFAELTRALFLPSS